VSLAIPSYLPLHHSNFPVVATNEASGNTLISATVQQNGTLTFGGAYSTGGNGEKGFTVPDTAVPDGLFSGDSVFVNTAKSLVAVVNVSWHFISSRSIVAKKSTFLIKKIGWF